MIYFCFRYFFYFVPSFLHCILSTLFFSLSSFFNSPKEGGCDCAFIVLIISVYSVAGSVLSKGKSDEERNVMQLHKSFPDVTAGLS